MSYTQPQKSPLAPATQALLELLRTAKLQTPNGPTVAGQAAMAAGADPNAVTAPAENAPPAEEQQGIAAILDQAKDAGPTIAQNQQEEQAQRTAQMAAQMVNQGQQPQAYAEGGIASLPVELGDYAEGGVLGYAGGGITEPTAESASQWAKVVAPKRDEEMMAEERRLYEERKQLAAARPDTSAQRAAAMREAYNKEVAFRPTEANIASLLGGARGLGGFAAAAIDTRRLFAARDAANKEGEQAQRDLEYAQKVKDNEGVAAALAARQAAKERYDTLTAGLAEKAIMAQANIYGTKMQSADSAANRAAQERIARMQADVRGANDQKSDWDKIEDDVAKELEQYYKYRPKERADALRDSSKVDAVREKIRQDLIARAKAAGANLPDRTVGSPVVAPAAQKSYSFRDIQ